MRILLVEDDAGLADSIARALRAEGFAVDVAGNGEDGGHLGSTESYSAAVLDLGLPKRSGISILTEWRQENRVLPVLILTARDGWTEKVEGFRAGADDYMTKPFRVEELVMRLRALVRRSAGHAAPRITCGPLSFDSQLGAFELDGLPLRLTGLEWRVLSCLILRKEVVVDRMAILEQVYEGDAEVDSNSLEVIVGRLRHKIGERGVRCQIDIAAELMVTSDAQDLDEMVGNLLDNAWKWAKTTVFVTAARAGAAVTIHIEDDGPGLSEAAVADALIPGRRLDESGVGYGFGLPIARELAELHGGALALDRSEELGGLRATLTLPARAA